MTQLYPPVLDPKTLTRQVWDTDSARRIPGVGRALDLIGGLISVMTLDAYRGIQPLPRPRLLEQPDLDLAEATFVRLQIEDYLVHGNAAHLVTARGADAMPAAVKWYAAHRWLSIFDPEDGRRRYWLDGREVSAYDVVHVQNGADPLNPARGVGVVERYVRTFDRVALEEESERQNIMGGNVPSVAVIAPQSNLSETEIDEAADMWEKKFAGPGRRPGIFPSGTTVQTLAWSPHDQQATLARQMSLTDVANAFNLDAYWLGAPGSSHTYRSPGPLFLTLLRTTLEPIVTPFEQLWSGAWLVRGKSVVFDRARVLADDMQTTVNTLTKATGGKPIMSVDEARTVLKLAPRGLDDLDPLAGGAPAGEQGDTDQDVSAGQTGEQEENDR